MNLLNMLRGLKKFGIGSGRMMGAITSYSGHQRKSNHHHYMSKYHDLRRILLAALAEAAKSLKVTFLCQHSLCSQWSGIQAMPA